MKKKLIVYYVIIAITFYAIGYAIGYSDGYNQAINDAINGVLNIVSMGLLGK